MPIKYKSILNCIEKQAVIKIEETIILFFYY